MTPSEKSKHLAALEDMYANSQGLALDFATCKADYDQLAADELKWRAAIDAFERLADHDHEADNVCDILHQVRKLCVQPERNAYDQLEARSDNETITVAQLRAVLKGSQ